MIEKKRFGLLFSLLSLLLIPIASAQFWGFDFYSLTYMYESYFEWFDFAIYFLIFGALARLVFEKKFGEERATVALYNGIAIFMSLGLVLYEVRYFGGPLLIAGGTGIFFVGMLMGWVALFSFITHYTGWGKIISGIISAVPFLILLYGLRDLSGLNLSGTIKDVLGVILVIGVAALIIWGLISLMRRGNRNRDGGDRVVIQGGPPGSRGPQGGLGPRGPMGQRGETEPVTQDRPQPGQGMQEEDRREDSSESTAVIDEEIGKDIDEMKEQVNYLLNNINWINRVLSRAIMLAGNKQEELRNKKVNVKKIVGILPKVRRLQVSKEDSNRINDLVKYIGRRDVHPARRYSAVKELNEYLEDIRKRIKVMKRKKGVLKEIDKEIIKHLIGANYAKTMRAVLQSNRMAKDVVKEGKNLEKDLKKIKKAA